MQDIDPLSLRRAQTGDRRALRQLLLYYQPVVHRLVQRMLVGQEAIADDICQESLLKVARALPNFDAQGPAKLSTWILTIATRTAIDHLRKPRLVEPPSGLSEHSLQSASPEQEAAQKQLAERVQQAVCLLPAEQRAALILRAYHDLDYPQIATILEISLGTVKSRIARARKLLREQLSKPLESSHASLG